MKKRPNILMLVGALLLLLLFVVPLWRITLVAPQYPDGITMYIWIDKITGDSEFTLQNINILNHYVGMQFIVPDAIPELKYFPYIVVAMALFGILISIRANRKLILTWAVAMVVLGALGLYDFYLWEYDYGHNLSPKAPIKVPGMAYQPPVFGSKMLLNFHASSYPHWGGIFLGLSIILAFAAFYLSAKAKKTRKPEVGKKPERRPAGITIAMSCLALGMFSFASCKPQPEPINFGHETCDYCQMNIVDPRFGSELVTSKGKVYKFDAIECMVSYMQQNQEDRFAIAMAGTVDKRAMVAAKDCHYLRTAKIPSPMGMYIAALSDKAVAGEYAKKYGGELYSWEQLQEQFSDLPDVHLDE